MSNENVNRLDLKRIEAALLQATEQIAEHRRQIDELLEMCHRLAEERGKLIFMIQRLTMPRVN